MRAPDLIALKSRKFIRRVSIAWVFSLALIGGLAIVGGFMMHAQVDRATANLTYLERISTQRLLIQRIVMGFMQFPNMPTEADTFALWASIQQDSQQMRFTSRQMAAAGTPSDLPIALAQIDAFLGFTEQTLSSPLIRFREATPEQIEPMLREMAQVTSALDTLERNYLTANLERQRSIEMLNWMRIAVLFLLMSAQAVFLIPPVIRSLWHEMTHLTTEIAARRRVEDELRQEQQLTRKVAEAMPDMIYIFDREEGRNVYANRELTVMLGYSAQEVQAMGSTLLQTLVHPHDLPTVQREAERARHGGDDDIFTIEYRMQHKDGSWRWLLSREIILNRMPDGRSRQVVGIAQDITERKRLGDQALALELEKSRIDLLREFMTITSHELRTPLTVISSSAYVISRTQDEARRQEKLLSIHDQIQRMALILDQFTGLLEIQSGDFEMCPVDVHHLLSQAEAVEHASIIAKRLTIDRQFEAGPICARGNRAYLQTAVSQLLQNAVRHTPPQGRITLRTRVDRHQVRIEIEDSGPGIEPESQPRVFELFYKANPGRTGDTSGAGIGLAMVKRIVEAHQGRVSVCSEIGHGTNFSMVLPASDTAAPALPEAG